MNSTRNPILMLQKFNLGVEKNNIVLTGKVSTDYEKELAGKAAERVLEDHSILNKVKVDPYHMRGDAEIGTACQRKLSLTKDLPVKKIEVEVDKGWGTLKGQVDSRQQKKLAEKVVEEIGGVTGVTNKLSVWS